MATSNSTDWTLNRDQVITGALRKLGVLPSGGTPSANQVSEASEALNALVKAFQADGMPVWKVTQVNFSTVDGTETYSVGPGLTIDIPKPLRIFQAFCTPSGGTKFPMRIEPRYDYFNHTSTTEGIPLILYYRPVNTSGQLRLWPTPDGVHSIQFHYHSPYEDMDSATNDFDFPSEWIQALIYNLAWSLSPEYGVPPTDRNLLAKEAEYWHAYVLSMGTEEGSIKFQPERG